MSLHVDVFLVVFFLPPLFVCLFYSFFKITVICFLERKRRQRGEADLGGDKEEKLYSENTG